MPPLCRHRNWRDVVSGPRRRPSLCFFQERCLRHRELDGHATPKWVLPSAARQRLCAPSLSEVFAFFGKFVALFVNCLIWLACF